MTKLTSFGDRYAKLRQDCTDEEFSRMSPVIQAHDSLSELVRGLISQEVTFPESPGMERALELVREMQRAANLEVAVPRGFLGLFRPKGFKETQAIHRASLSKAHDSLIKEYFFLSNQLELIELIYDAFELTMLESCVDPLVKRNLEGSFRDSSTVRKLLYEVSQDRLSDVFKNADTRAQKVLDMLDLCV